DAIKLISALQGDVRLLRQQVAEARTERDRQKFKVIGLRAAVAEQPHYEEQQNRLMRWLIDNEPEASLACDADKGVAGAIIDTLEKQRLAIANYDTALTSAQNEAAMLRQQRADLQADLEVRHQELVQAEYEAQAVIAHLQSQTTNANGASPDPTPTPDWGPSHPAWQALTAEEQETIAKLAAGTIKFRGVIKARRLILIGQVLRHIGGGRGKITMAQYNSQRPAWMAEASSITQYVESNKWQDVVTAAMLYTQTAAAQ
ncbi:MAG: hypothetical protein QG660_802, partial [Pseudomonadota bacterium]|nr:hypothetical protein [Pseudomonadota bacterium]